LAGGTKFGNSDTAVGLQGGVYNLQSAGYTGKSAQAGGVVTDPKALAGYSKAFNTVFAPLLAKGYTQQQITQYIQTLPGPQIAKIQGQLYSATNSILNPDTTLDKVMQGLALAGSAIGVGLLTGGAIAPALSAAGADAAGSVGALAGNAAAGALGGGVMSGLEGQNIGKGALLGGVGGALGSAATPAAESLSSSTGLPTFASTGLVKAGIGAATSAAAGSNPLLGAVSAGAGSLAGGAASSLGAGAASGFIGNQVGNFASSGVGRQGNNGNMASTNTGESFATPAPNIQSGAQGGPFSNPIGVGAGVGAGVLQGNVIPPSNNNAPGSSNYVAPSTDTSLAQTIGSAVPGLLQGAASIYGSQNAAEASTQGQQASIAQQQQTLGNINNIWSTQQQTGQGANTALQQSLGLNGQTANQSNFLNMPGYQFAVQQGTQAIQRQAASMGNAYTPNTAEAVGQYVTGTASQDYNTYIQQLMGAAGLGTTANQGLQTGQQTTGNNISQSQQNIGAAQASGVQSSAGTVAGLFGVNGAGSSLIGAAGRALTGGSSGGGNSGGGSSGGVGTDQTDQLTANGGQLQQSAIGASAPSFDFSGVGGTGNSTSDLGNIDSSSFDYGFGD
jgi:hypothetical protein